MLLNDYANDLDLFRPGRLSCIRLITRRVKNVTPTTDVADIGAGAFAQRLSYLLYTLA
jgi:hypothetical protein